MKVKLGEIYRGLDDEDKKILFTIESELSRYLYVPVRVILSKTKIPPKRLNERLENLVKNRVLARRLGAEVGYTLTMLGLDVLALDSLVSKGCIQALGEKVNVGKEADIYEALSPAGHRLALKFYRVGRTSFRQTTRLRPYVTERDIHSWLDESILSAQREYKALVELSRLTEYVPKPVGYSRHAVVIEYIEGVELYRVNALRNPMLFLEGIIDVIKIAYKEVGIVHGDLSEYNILVAYPEEKPIVIDWPQYTYRDHPSSMNLLRRDVRYVLRYFSRKFGLKLEEGDILKEIVEGT